MKSGFLNILFLITLVSCLQENIGILNDNATTFVRYYNDGLANNATSFQETSDNGFIILSTMSYSTTVDNYSFSIKLMKTTPSGLPIWTKIYPTSEFRTDSSGDLKPQTKNYLGSKIILLPDDSGYLIIGVNIKSDGGKNILAIIVDNEGNIIKENILKESTQSYEIVGVGINNAGNYIITATSEGLNNNDKLYICELDNANLTVIWNKTYPINNLIAKSQMLIDEEDKIIFAGTRYIANENFNVIRLMRTSQNSQTVDFDLPIAEPTLNDKYFSISLSDFCPSGDGYAIVGSSNKKVGISVPTDSDIMFKLITKEGRIISSVNYLLGSDDNQNDTGTSIIPTEDGGFMLLASVNSVAINGRGEYDYLIIKTDQLGNKLWSSSFGSRFEDKAISIIQATDGGYVILGTSVQGGIVMTMLAKTDKNGNIN